MSEAFFKDLLTSKKDKKAIESVNILDKLYQKPVKDKQDDKAHFPHVTPNYWQQSDLLFLPNDKGYLYALVVTDVGSRKVDAEALKSKSTEDVLQAFKTIYKRKIIGIPKQLTCDAGTEFHGITKTGLLKMGIHINYGKAGRHRQTALVERKNQTIGTLVHKLIIHDQIASGSDSSSWVETLPMIVKVINDKVEDQKVNIDNKEYPHNDNFKVKLLEEGDKVRVLLDNPIGFNGNKLHGKFRSSDIKWDPTIRTIKHVILKPDQPPLYLLDGTKGPLQIEPIGYTVNQLQLITSNEIAPEKPITNVESNRFEVEKIIGKKKEKNIIYYLIKWRGHHKSKATYEKRSSLIKEIPQTINNYEKSLI